MASGRFDHKFGKNYLESAPTGPGVYRFFGVDDRLIYVGKAKNLRRRLSQYKNAKRLKRHAKMRSVVREGVRLEWEGTSSELDALLLETRLIQEHRPKWNVAGAFYFLYPMIGFKEAINGDILWCYTTSPEKLDFKFHGAYRSRKLTREAFLSLIELLSVIGHRESPQDMRKNHGIIPPRFSHLSGFRQLQRAWPDLTQEWNSFLKGESNQALKTLSLLLLENAGARKRAGEVQEHLRNISRFWKHEALPLAKAMAFSKTKEYPLPQRERDLLFLRAKYSHLEKEEPSHELPRL